MVPQAAREDELLLLFQDVSEVLIPDKKSSELAREVNEKGNKGCFRLCICILNHQRWNDESTKRLSGWFPSVLCPFKYQSHIYEL
jgi:hypothetical protein